MQRSSLYALIAAVFVLAQVSLTDVRAQSNSAQRVISKATSAVSIVDGISLGIRKSQQGESELWVEANNLKATVMTRSEGKLFRRTSALSPVGEPSRPIQEIAVAFE